MVHHVVVHRVVVHHVVVRHVTAQRVVVRHVTAQPAMALHVTIRLVLVQPVAVRVTLGVMTVESAGTVAEDSSVEKPTGRSVAPVLAAGTTIEFTMCWETLLAGLVTAKLVGASLVDVHTKDTRPSGSTTSRMPITLDIQTLETDKFTVPKAMELT